MLIFLPGLRSSWLHWLNVKHMWTFTWFLIKSRCEIDGIQLVKILQLLVFCIWVWNTHTQTCARTHTNTVFCFLGFFCQRRHKPCFCTHAIHLTLWQSDQSFHYSSYLTATHTHTRTSPTSTHWCNFTRPWNAPGKGTQILPALFLNIVILTIFNGKCSNKHVLVLRWTYLDVARLCTSVRLRETDREIEGWINVRRMTAAVSFTW